MNEFLAKTTRGNAINLKCLPLDFRSKVLFTETHLVSPPSLKGCNFYHIYNRSALLSLSRYEGEGCCLPVHAQGRVCPVPFQWPGRGLPVCLAAPALLGVKESPELGKPSGAWVPVARADVRRCLKEAENDRAEPLKQQKNSFFETQRHRGWGCARQLGQSDSLLPPKVSASCCFKKLGVSGKHKSSCKRRSRQLQSEEGGKPSLWGSH